MGLYKKLLVTLILSWAISPAFSQNYYLMETKTVTDTSGYLVDDGDTTANYTANQVLTFKINVGAGKTVRLQWLEFDVETNEAGLGQACIYDYVELYDGEPDAAAPTARYCGGEIPPVFTATSGTLSIVFTSDGAAEYPGFKAFWTTGELLPAVDYCAARGGDCVNASGANTDPNSDHITTVTIDSDNGAVTNNSGCNSGYANFTNVPALMATWTVGDAYTISFDRFISYAFGLAGAFIDWNEDLDFSDPGESIPVTVTAGATDNTAVVTPPADVPTGYKRLRLRLTLTPETSSSCGFQDYGEVEDYRILVINPMDTLPACVDPATVTPANGTANHCLRQTLRWGSSADATAYKVSLSLENDPNPVLVNSAVTDTFLVVPSTLMQDTDYVWTVTPYNDNGNAIGCGSFTFRTSPSADPQASIIPAQDTVETCAAVPVLLNGNPTLGTAPYTHRWNGIMSSNALLTDTTSQTPLFVADSGMYTYSYTVSDANNCRASDTITIKVNPTPAVSYPEAMDSVLCAGEYAILRLTASEDAIITWEDSTATQPWMNTNSVTPFFQNYITTALTKTTFFRATATYPGTGCSATGPHVQIIVHTPDTAPGITVIANTPICEGDAVVLKSSFPTGNTWNTGATTQSIVVNTSGSYFITRTDPNGCITMSDSEFIIFGIRPQTPVITQNGDILHASNTGPDYQWFDKNGPIAGATLSSYAPSQSGDYRVVTYSVNGCSSDTSAKFYFSGVGIQENAVYGLSIHPNPADDAITISFDNATVQEITVTLCSVYGQVIISQSITAGNNKLDVRNLASGTYLLKATATGVQVIRPLVISR